MDLEMLDDLNSTELESLLKSNIISWEDRKDIRFKIGLACLNEGCVAIAALCINNMLERSLKSNK